VKLRYPRLDSRRTSDFEKELRERARAWISSWSLDDGERDFGQALLEIAARFNSEVAERLDGAGDKMARGFLDWLAVRGEAARPARMPVVFKLTETAVDPVQALHPVKMQVDARGTNVTFETDTDVRLVPGNLDRIVGVDPAKDAFFLSPPGISNLDQLEPLPTQWRVKSFAAAGTNILQLDPGTGLKEEMLVEIAGAQYRIANPKDDLVMIEPPVPAGAGFAINTLVTKVEAFYPFDGARNQQNHILYLGHADLFNIEAQAVIDVIGVEGIGSGVTWEYWGKDKNAAITDAEPRWRDLTPDKDPLRPGALVLKKPAGTIEPRQIGTAESRWIRAHKTHLDASTPLLTSDEINLRINAKPATNVPGASDDPAALPPIEAVVNTAPSPTKDFFPLGREPRLFDSFYLGCAEAFSKNGASVEVEFDLAESSFIAMAGCNYGYLLGNGLNVLAGVDKAGSLHLFSIDANGALTYLFDRGPQRPKDPNAIDGGDASGIPLTSSKFRPVIWNNGFLSFSVVVSAGNQVWLWHEAMLPQDRGWSFWGSPEPDSGPSKIIEGLAAIEKDGVRALVAFMNGRLWIRGLGAGAQWELLNVTIGANEEIESIAPVGSDKSQNLSDRILIIVKNTNTSSRTLYVLTSSGDKNKNKLFDNVAADVVPFGIRRVDADRFEYIAAQNSDTTRKLVALKNGSDVSVELDSDLSVAGTFIDGQIENGELTAYCLANSTSGVPELLAWTPFDPDLKSQVFRNRSDTVSAIPKGPVTLFNGRAYLPGSNEGEILGAVLGMRQSFMAVAETFKSALAIPHPAPALELNDTVAIKVSGVHELAKVDAAVSVDGLEEFSSQRFFWLDHWVDRNTMSDEVLIFTTSLVNRTGKINSQGTSSTSFELNNSMGIQPNMFILVEDGVASGDYKLVKITSLTNTTATLKPRLLSEANTSGLPYFLPQKVSSRVFPALALDGSNNDWDAKLLYQAGIYFPKASPKRQRAIAVLGDPTVPERPLQIALKDAWNTDPSIAAPTKFMVVAATSEWTLLRSDTSSNPALAWEYWNGTGWWRLQIKEDHTDNLKNSGSVTFEVPGDLKPTDWAGKTSHWIRARLIGGDYGHETVVVKTDPVAGGGTEQTVERSTKGIQPPYAFNVLVRYSIDQPVLPTFLLTQDNGTLRNQSDANRTPGAVIEVFTPLIHALRHLDEQGAVALSMAEECVPECECPEGTASKSPVKKIATPAPTVSSPSSVPRAERRALYLGLDSKLSGEPINLLLVVEKEQNHDKFAPINVDALIGDRFVPVLAKDNTRAIGETGLISMSFSVEPIPSELFGRSLSWLRLTPGNVGIQWNPTLRGAYLNAVWARAAETMTRELVGSSEGAPNLTLQLARPPLLKDSLELRVREPLGAEEREQLVAVDPESVKSNVTDLPGHWVLWKQVADPKDHEATARVYSLDEDTGIIRFGDGLHGAIPPIVADGIVAFKYERTEPATSDGVPANFVTARSPLNLVTPVESVEAAIAADQSAGGVAPESVERVLRFGAAKLRHRGRAVTAGDFEDLALERFADVVQARCFVNSGRVRLIVVMRGRNPAPSQAQRRELRTVLLAASPVTLAAPGVLRIEGPTVRRLRIRLILRVAALDVAGDLASYVKRTLQSFFDTDTIGENRDVWMLGASPREDDIAEALLDAPNLESIVDIVLSEVDANGSEHLWPQAIKASELTMLDDDGIRIAFDIVETVV
jgi:hypothetical protein